MAAWEYLTDGTPPSYWNDWDTSAITVGLRFVVVGSGVEIVGMRFHRDAGAQTGTFTAQLHNKAGTLLKSQAVTVQPGWNEVAWASPVAGDTAEVYTVSVFCSGGQYPSESGHFTTSGKTSAGGHIYAPRSGEAINGDAVTVNGVYTTNGVGAKPEWSYEGSFYWVEPIVSAGIAGSLTSSETGTDAASFAGSVGVHGSLAAVEGGADTASGSGSVGIGGTVAATEMGSDAASLAGEVASAGIDGSLSAAEHGSDTASFTGSVEGGELVRPNGADPFWDRPTRRGSRRLITDTRTGFQRLYAQLKAAERAVEAAPEAPRPTVTKAVKKAVTEVRKALPVVEEAVPAVDWRSLLGEMERAAQAQADRDQQLAALRQALEQAQRAQREFEEDEETALMLLLVA